MNGENANDPQFYPTPKALAEKMWKKFRVKKIQRCLEPSCGNGDLLMGNSDIPFEHTRNGFQPVRLSGRGYSTDACEIDVRKHAGLKEMSINVVGIDFLEFTTGAVYSHVIMNPPFAQGAKHVLHAWNILWDGEIVALVNAETIRNPHSAERQLLVRLIEQHGDVEFVQGAFQSPETMRKTEVECAIVYLRKEAARLELLDRLMDDLDKDLKRPEEEMGAFKQMTDVALPFSVVEQQVRVFNMAVAAERQAVIARAHADVHASRLGKTMAEQDNAESGPVVLSAEQIRGNLAQGYLELKDRAWTSILRGSEVTSKLSSKAQKTVEADFERIKQLEFTVKNIYGFLLGIAEAAGDIQMSMICDVFDEIGRYHSDNVSWYRGWRSNNAHRTMGMKIKARRFILPRFDFDTWRKTVSFGDRKRLEDIDRVFAILDGVAKPEVSLVELFETQMGDLMKAQRLSTTYFDVRAYKGIKTVHFFPKRADLIDRLNRIVGAHRQWLPTEPMPQAEDYWKQYDQAEKMDAAIRKEVESVKMGYSRFAWIGPLGVLASACAGRSNFDQGEVGRAYDVLDKAMKEVHSRHGIDVDRQIESSTPQLRLAA